LHRFTAIHVALFGLYGQRAWLGFGFSFLVQKAETGKKKTAETA